MSLKPRRAASTSPCVACNEHLVIPASRASRGRQRDRHHVRRRRRVAQSQRRLPLHAVRAGARAAGVPVLRSAGPEGALDARARRPRRLGGGRQRRRDRRATIAGDRTTAALRGDRSRFRPTCSRSPPASSRSRRRSATAARSACSTARPTPRRSRATATRSSTCTPRRSPGSSATPGIPYPFGKFDFVAHARRSSSAAWSTPARSSTTRRACCSTSRRRRTRCSGRASVIAHETAHMWFGDLVTMRWFNDVWMKEVFANFMAAKIVNPSFPEINHDLRFLLRALPGRLRGGSHAGHEPDPPAARQPATKPAASTARSSTRRRRS